MRSSPSLVLACVLRLALVTRAQLAEPASDSSPAGAVPTAVDAPGGEGNSTPDSTVSSSPSTTITLTQLQAVPTASPYATSSSQPATVSTTIDTIEVSSFMTSRAQTSSSTVPTSTQAAAVTPSALATLSAPSSSHGLDSHQTLIIILSSVLGVVGILLITAAVFLAYRLCQGRSPFGRRSATPLDDDEIDSWRGTVIEQKERPSDVDPTMLNRRANSIQMHPSPGWTWTASPTSIRSGLSPTTTVPDTPAFLARAPNSRIGLTDETIPGEDPFLPPVKRQSSRLSKAPPGHNRSKSRRSSMSAKSVWSYSGGPGSNPSEKMPIWFDPDDNAIGIALSRTDRTATNSPATSELNDVAAGGLSPRPRSQTRPSDNAIGRAIF